MRWGEASAKPGALNWVRPLHSIVAMFGPETEEPDVVPFEVGGIAAGDTTLRPPLHGAGADQGEAARRLRGQARRRQGRGRSGAPRADDPGRRQDARLRAGLRAGRGRGPAGRGRRPGRMAGGADGRVRRGVPRDPRGGDPRHHPQQPEMLRGARSEDGEARQQVHPGVEHRGERRRQAPSSPATSASSARGCPTRSSSTTPI